MALSEELDFDELRFGNSTIENLWLQVSQSIYI